MCSEKKIDWIEVPDSIKNKHKEVKTTDQSLKMEITARDFSVITGDKKEIFGTFYFNESRKNEKQPVVILIHQFNEDRLQWKSSFTDSLLALGYKAVAFDIRGHGKSDKQNGKLEDILSDPEQAPKDITAVVEWIKTQPGIDTSRIAAIGTSIGGNLALYAGLSLGVKVPIAVSNGKSTFEAFTGYNELMMGRPNFPRMKNALLICGSKDGDHEAGQKWILENFCELPKDMMVFDSDKHGKFLIEEKPEINTLVFEWLKKYL